MQLFILDLMSYSGLKLKCCVICSQINGPLLCALCCLDHLVPVFIPTGKVRRFFVVHQMNVICHKLA